MNPFVNQIAQFLKNSDISLQNWVVILPSERAAHYVQRALFEAYQKPIFSPKIQTIHRWVHALTNKSILDKTRLLLVLYEVHKQKEGDESALVFDEFLHWGNILLADFDEMDRYLLDSKQLFRNLSDIKELESWNIEDGRTLSASQQRFLEFWERLPGYYHEFNLLLQKQQATYMGKAYRQLQENIDRVFTDNKEAHFLFAGFNALSPAEKSIFKQLHRLGRGHVFIDADHFYLDDPIHEAGTFMRDYIREIEIKNPLFVQNSLLTEAKDIQVIACAQATGQAKVIGTLLENVPKENLEKTLVLLADESLIVPMLQHLPKHIEKANITLGLPLRNTSLRTWVDLIFHIQEGFQKYNRRAAYYKDLFQLWNHPFVQAFLTGDEKQALYQLEKDIRKFNRIFQNPDKLIVPVKVKKLIENMYQNWDNKWSVALACIRELSIYIHDQLPDSSEFEKAILQSFDQAIIDFENCVLEGFPDMSLRSFRSLFQQQWSTASMAYYGNPLDGLQIMGLLETRLLDFETIFVLGLNEGKMPPTNPIQTLIPMDLRRYMGLPTPREKQGLFAHHFYRLLHQCKQMVITYSMAAESIHSNEQSRYVMQLEKELVRRNPLIRWQRKDYTLSNEDVVTRNVQIPKTDAIHKRLDELFANGTSASAIKTFMTCPLDFYYKYVLKFGEEEKVEEELESNTFGTFIHEVLEEMYTPFARRDSEGKLKEQQPRSIQVEDIDWMLKNYEYEMRKKFSAHFNQEPEAFEKGKNFLSFSMALELTERFLKNERKILLELNNRPLFIEGLEQSLVYDLELEILGKKRNVRLKGNIDRIDSIDGKIRIIDYKTGKVKSEDVGPSEKRPKSFDSNVDAFVEWSQKNKHFFQLMVYNYLYFQHTGQVADSSSIVSFINLKESPFKLRLGNYSTQELVEAFPAVLTQLIEAIYDPETDFIHKDAGQFSYCVYC